jgi:hypothetical protein
MRCARIAKTPLVLGALAGAALIACGDADAPPPPPPPPRSAPPSAESPTPTPAPPQAQTERPWWDKEFGVGVVSYAAMDRYEAEDVIRATPSAASDTVAVLKRDSLCFRAGACVRSYERMIEFDYEIPGWAILGFTGDSSWARVSLAPLDTAGPTGWVALGDSVQALLWSRTLPTNPLFFLRPSDIAFYDAPTEAARTMRALVRRAGSEELDYIMMPLEARGDWLRVVLQTPSTYCAFPEPEVKPDTLWIRYLRADGRPRVFYYTRGC